MKELVYSAGDQRYTSSNTRISRIHIAKDGKPSCGSPLTKTSILEKGLIAEVNCEECIRIHYGLNKRGEIPGHKGHPLTIEEIQEIINNER